MSSSKTYSPTIIIKKIIDQKNIHDVSNNRRYCTVEIQPGQNILSSPDFSSSSPEFNFYVAKEGLNENPRIIVTFYEHIINGPDNQLVQFTLTSLPTEFKDLESINSDYKLLYTGKCHESSLLSFSHSNEHTEGIIHHFLHNYGKESVKISCPNSDKSKYPLTSILDLSDSFFQLDSPNNSLKIDLIFEKSISINGILLKFPQEFVKELRPKRFSISNSLDGTTFNHNNDTNMMISNLDQLYPLTTITSRHFEITILFSSPPIAISSIEFYGTFNS